MWLLVVFPNRVIFEILRARSLATGFGDTSTAISIALDPLICIENSVLCDFSVKKSRSHELFSVVPCRRSLYS